MKVRMLSRPAAAIGLELTGLPVTCVQDGVSAGHTLKQWAADPDVGIVLVDESLYRAVPREVMARLDRQALPVITPVPAPLWDERGEAQAYILEILRQAVGYRVRPR